MVSEKAPTDRPSPAELIRQLRADMGRDAGQAWPLSLDKLAEIIGTSRQTIIRWEHGTEPTLAYREKLSELSGRPASDYEYARTSPAEVAVRLGELVLAAESLADRLEALLLQAQQTAVPDEQPPSQHDG